MTKNFTISLLTGLAVLTATSSCEQKRNEAASRKEVVVAGADVTEVGIYTAHVAAKMPVPGVVGGTNEGLDSFTLVEATTNVPARIGARFGFRYTIRGTPPNAPLILTMIGEHPPYTNEATGKTETRDEYQLQSWIGETYTSYSLDREMELTPGTFRFEVRYKDKKLCEQSFTIVPETRPEAKQ